MANLNKVMLIGRLTRDPEHFTFKNGGGIATFGFAVTGERKKDENGQYQDVPCFIDCKAFTKSGDDKNRAGDIILQYVKKGHQVYLEGHLILEQWEDKNDQSKRSALRMMVDQVQLLQPKEDQGSQSGQQPRQQTRQPQRSGQSTSYPDQDAFPPQDGDIPF